MRFRNPVSLGLAVLTLACTDRSRSPVGGELLPDGALDGDLQVIVLDEWSLAADYEVFPSARAESDRLVSALAWPDEEGFDSRPLFRFSVAELDSLPADAEILTAALTLVFAPSPETPISFSVHRITEPWSSEAATWDRRDFGLAWSEPGGDFEPAPIVEFTIEPTGAISDSVQVDFPLDLIESWRSGTTSNDGLVVLQQTPGESVEFVSRGGGGINPNGPRIVLDVQIGGAGGPISRTPLLADEDTFIAFDRGGFDGGGLRVAAGDPVLRTVLVPVLDAVPAGATIADVKLIVSVDDARVPSDSIQALARETFSEFRGEKTVLAPVTATTVLGLTTIVRDSLPVDSLVFQSTRLRTIIRRWISDPETITGIALTILDEETQFGGFTFFGPQAAPALRPRLRLVVLPPSSGSGR